MFALTRTVIVPPYCGTPNESHQWPVVVAVVVVLFVFDAVVVVAVVFVVVVVLVVIDVDVIVVVVLLHDAKTSDVVMRQVSAIQITLLFIQTSFYLLISLRIYLLT